MTETNHKHLAVQELINSAKQHTKTPLNRSGIEAVLTQLKVIAAQKQWWSAHEYPAPTEGELQARYLIHEEPDHSYALYLNVMKPGKKSCPTTTPHGLVSQQLKERRLIIFMSVPMTANKRVTRSSKKLAQ